MNPPAVPPAADWPSAAPPLAGRARRGRVWDLRPLLGLMLLTAAAALAPRLRPERRAPLPPSPLRASRLEWRGAQRVLHLSGTPEELGRQHGELLGPEIRFMLNKYIEDMSDKPELLSAVPRMRRSLPRRFLRELDACAAAADVDPDLLLLAQCEGDLRSAYWDEKLREDAEDDELRSAAPRRRAREAACTSYVAFGPATVGGRLEAGRNLDYWVGEGVVKRCALVACWDPAPGDGCRFAAVGFAGILTGWTLVNEHGLIVANHLGGGSATSLDAVPTLLLARELAQHATTVEEALARLKRLPRMRGQIIWLAQPADPAIGRPARAVAAEYDNQELWVREAEDGVLIVTNENLVFGGKAPSKKPLGGRFGKLGRLIEERYGRLDGRALLTREPGVLSGTLHTVQALPEQGRFLVVFEAPFGAPEPQPVAHPWPGRE